MHNTDGISLLFHRYRLITKIFTDFLTPRNRKEVRERIKELKNEIKSFVDK
jgi:hypothetical protein